MRALKLYGLRDIRLVEAERPSPSSGEVLLRVGACGICGTDIHFYRGEVKVRLPLIPGHEFSGVVEEVGEGVDWIEEGVHAVAEPNIVCGHCEYCRQRRRNFYCRNIRAVGVDVDGAFAEYVKVPAENVYTIPAGMPLEEAALIEPLACCVRGLDNVGLEEGDYVAVVGAGPIGLLLLQLARMWGAARTYAVDVVEERLRLARELGADVAINAAAEDPVEAIKSDTDGLGVDVAMEAVGSSRAVETAFEVVRRGGRLLIFGVAPENDVWSVRPYAIYEKEIMIVASYRSPFTFQRAVRIAASGRVRLRPIISHVMPLEMGPEAFRMVDERRRGVVKVVLKP